MIDDRPTNLKDASLLVGIGSPHGSDRVGWVVADLLEPKLPSPWEVRRARVPTDLLDWIDGCGRLHLLDACPLIERVGTVHRLEWPDRRITESRTATSHDYDLPQVLQLAQRLGQLPQEVVVWAIEVAAGAPLEENAPWIDAVAHRIRNDLNHAPRAS